jgi:glycerol-3-phosphate dehydrogenase
LIPTYDLLIIGGGINGVGLARDAARRGLSVIVCEQGDLGGATSSASSKLLHGGLRYLEQRHFRLVREALAEREVLLTAAPHIVSPLRFVLPHDKRLRPAWQLRAGLLLYDNLARRQTLPGSESVELHASSLGAPLDRRFTKGFVYSDCWVDDARLVILNALDAKARGADIRRNVRCVEAIAGPGRWNVVLQDVESDDARMARAKLIVNAAGPWAGPVLKDVLGLESRFSARLVKGSHIVTHRLYEGEQAYILQNADRRVVFVLPFERDFTLIGTTDVPYESDPAEVEIDAEEIDYLCAAVNASFAKQIGPADVVWSFSGVRPLYDDGSASVSEVTRDYALERHAGDAPALTIWGGKLTGYRVLAERVLDELRHEYPTLGQPWTAGAPLPGGELFPAGIERFIERAGKLWPFLPPEVAAGYAHRYGMRMHQLLGNISTLTGLGRELTPGLYEREAGFLVREEWARSAADILWRRTKLGLRATPDDAQALADWLHARAESSPTG